MSAIKTVYVFDYIGISSGMHYYFEALEEQLKQIHNIKVEVMSNYSKDSENTTSFIPIIFRKGLFCKVYNIIRTYFKLFTFVRRHNDAFYIYFCYGSIVDVVFMPVILKANNCILDIHDPIMKGKESSTFLIRQLSKNYKRAKTIIYHSDSALKTVQNLNFSGKSIFVPHFQYTLSEKYDSSNINKDLIGIIEPSKCNVLFFGNINYSKGPDLFIESVNSLPETINNDYNFIIAGKVSDSCLDGLVLDKPILRSVFRKINDDELKYLYSNVDYIILPYRETYQSGVLEMAFKFKVPVIVSDVPYFKSLIEKYPSFGILTKADIESITTTLLSLRENKGPFYADKDIEKYNNRKEFIDFRKQIREAILAIS